MDPNKPPDLSGMTGVPWLGRGRALQPQEPAVGRSRGLPLFTEGPGLGRARGFLTLGDTPRRRGVGLPIAEPVVGLARGLLLKPEDGVFSRARELLFQATEPKVGVARGAILPSLEPQHRQTPPPPPETTTPHLTEETLKVGVKKKKSIFVHIQLQLFYKYNSPTLRADVFICLQVDTPTSALVSMFRGIGIDSSMTSWGRGTLPVGLYRVELGPILID